LFIETLNSARELGTKEALSLKHQVIFFDRFRNCSEHLVEIKNWF